MRITTAISGVLIVSVMTFAGHAFAEPLRLKGNMFINAMKGNTLSGKTGDGVSFNAYFLSGGIVNYEDANGAKDAGQWHVDSDGDVCVAFRQINDGKEDCFVVTLDGRNVSWKGKARTGSGKLRGSIVEGFLEE